MVQAQRLGLKVLVFNILEEIGASQALLGATGWKSLDCDVPWMWGYVPWFL